MDLTVAITGATSGIGRAVAEAFVDEGAFVAVSGRDGAAVDRTVAALNGEGDDGDDPAGVAWGARVDVRD
ncbi:short-chain dehydrogenase, partial [Halorubrum sp. E3]